ncbi:GMC oxidoreductase [Saccharata proteae CBS 121410]|uniref:GMC oxidoreductase n=1 Tax=Saccharata proteae CBS 121410 TaxID=1314787 RepID=A0A9P4HTK0_9PEZI|nr:GMC oxidoreductase [Saccharata proteae CBS 121410]
MDSLGRQDLSSAAFLDSETFDTIIIGGGTSGLVTATRLSEDCSNRVLVIEAGADRRDDPRVFTPGLAAATYYDPDFDWCFMTKPQPGLNGRQIAQPKGRLLGGSTAINLGLMIYPSKSGFDAWEKLGNPGWSWEGMTSYFKKFHTYHPPSEKIREQLNIDYIEEALHGTDGPIQTSFGEDHYTPYNDAWPKTFKNLGYKISGDPLSGISTGGYTNTGTIDPKTKHRSHAGNAYLTPEVTNRPNLRILTETLADKLILEKTEDGSVIAKGVEVTLKDGTKRQILAQTEVILATGTIKTPQILELSGIGDANLLRSHGIDVVIDNPHVGENLQDHGFVCCSWEVNDPTTSGDMLRNPEVAGACMEAFQKAGAGPLGVCTIVNAYMPIIDFAAPSGKSQLDDLLTEYLDNHTYKPFPAQKAQYDLLRQILHNKDDGSGQYELAPFQLLPDKGPSPKGIFGMTDPDHYISIVSVLNHPFSRGSVHINSPDPKQQPDIDPGFLDHPLDLELHARHTLWLETLAHTEPMASLLKKDGRRLHSDKPLPMTLDEAKQITRDRIVSHYHVAGSCAMMPEELGGVVDSRLKVYGTRNLRIVDASVFPLMPRGNIQADVYAVAEKAADVIKEDRAAAKN